MKVIALGGAGVMGSFAARILAGSPRVGELVIADRNRVAAERLAGELGDKCRAKIIDAGDRERIESVIRGFDVVLGMIGPFYKYETIMIQACIDAGTDYVSICDDHDGTTAALELDGAAKEAGITAVTGVGWTPGITNMPAKLGTENIKNPDTIDVYWGCHAADTRGGAGTLHALHVFSVFSGFVPSFRGGRIRWIPAGSGRERIRFPEPLGEVIVSHLGHPEPVTLSRYLSLRSASLKGGFKEQGLNKLALLLNQIGLTKTKGRKDDLARIANKLLLPLAGKLSRKRECTSACRVDIVGKEKTGYVHRTLGPVGHMDMLTGLPCAIAVEMLVEGKISSKGVMGPEACLNPREFLARLEMGGIHFFEGDRMTTRLHI